MPDAELGNWNGLRALARVLCLGSMLLAGCVSTQVGSIVDSQRGYARYADERILIQRSAAQDQDLNRLGFVFDDPLLINYINQVAQRLVQEPLPDGFEFRVYVLRDPTLNAFAMANGSIYVHVGLLARLDNEAQLAYVLAHEIAHTFNRHQLRGYRDLQNKTMIAKVVEMATFAGTGVGVPGIGFAGMLTQLTYSAFVNGYSRELEQEADRDGLRRLAAAGYAVDEASKTFLRLNELYEPPGFVQLFWSTHPLNTQRAEYVKELVEQRVFPGRRDGRKGVAEYRNAVWRAVLDTLKLRLRKQHYDLALHEADVALERYGQRAQLEYFRGEALRGLATRAELGERAGHGWFDRANDTLTKRDRERIAQDRKAAQTSYRNALVLDSSLYRAHRGLGLLAYEEDDRATASDQLETYLRRTRAPVDRRFIEHILQEIRRDGPPQSGP